MLDGLNAVAVGKADAAITFLGAGHYLQVKYQITNLKFAAVLDRDRFSESIGGRKDWPELAAIMDKALASVIGRRIYSANAGSARKTGSASPTAQASIPRKKSALPTVSNYCQRMLRVSAHKIIFAILHQINV